MTTLSALYEGNVTDTEQDHKPVTHLSDLYKGSNLAEKLKKYRLPGIQRLFKEMWGSVINEPMEPLLNLTEDDDETTLSLKKLYMKYWYDPTEVAFVDAELGGRWDIWNKMVENKSVAKYITALREEARARYISNNFRQISRLAQEGDIKTQMAALKFLTSTVMGDTDSSKRGRPSKKEIQQRTNEILAEDKELQEAFSRVVPIESLRSA